MAKPPPDLIADLAIDGPETGAETEPARPVLRTDDTPTLRDLGPVTDEDAPTTLLDPPTVDALSLDSDPAQVVVTDSQAAEEELFGDLPEIPEWAVPPPPAPEAVTVDALPTIPEPVPMALPADALTPLESSGLHPVAEPNMRPMTHAHRAAPKARQSPAAAYSPQGLAPPPPMELTPLAADPHAPPVPPVMPALVQRDPEPESVQPRLTAIPPAQTGADYRRGVPAPSWPPRPPEKVGGGTPSPSWPPAPPQQAEPAPPPPPPAQPLSLRPSMSAPPPPPAAPPLRAAEPRAPEPAPPPAPPRAPSVPEVPRGRGLHVNRPKKK